MKKDTSKWGRITSIIILAVFVAVPVFSAEMRTWTAVNGQTLEARYVRQTAGKIVLEKTNGKTISIAPSKLCKADRDYANNQIVPTLKVALSRKTSTKSYDYDDTKQKVECVIKIEKTSRLDYNKKLTVEAFLLGEDLGEEEIIMLSTEKFKNVVLPSGRGKIVEINMKPVKTDFDDEGYKYGEKYHGYAVFVFTEDGQLIASKASKGTYTEKLHLLRSGKLESF